MKKYYNIYKINKENMDLVNVYGSEDRKAIASYLNITINNFSKYSTKDMEQMPQFTKLIDNESYIIIIDND
jgi:hypothetical protein